MSYPTNLIIGKEYLVDGSAFGKGISYNFRAAAYHSGSAKGGHYIAKIYHDGIYSTHNDEHVTIEPAQFDPNTNWSPEEFLQDTGINGATATMLFYEKTL